MSWKCDRHRFCPPLVVPEANRPTPVGTIVLQNRFYGSSTPFTNSWLSRRS